MFRYLGVSLGNSWRVVAIEDDQSPVVIPVSIGDLTDPVEIGRQIKANVEEALGASKKTFACVTVPDHFEAVESEPIYKALNSIGIQTFRVVTHSSAIGYAYDLEDDHGAKILVIHIYPDSLTVAIVEAYGSFYPKALARAENLDESTKDEKLGDLLAAALLEAEMTHVELNEIIVSGQISTAQEQVVASAMGRSPRIERDSERLTAFGSALLCRRVGNIIR